MGEKIYALLDCDSFFVSCEQVLNPKIQNFPVCVLSNNMGCVVARSKEAKEMGIQMGMPYFQAKRQFPGAVYLRGDHTIYKDFSKRIMKLLEDFSPNIEVYSIDEAFIDLTGTRKMHGKNYYKVVSDIKRSVKEKVGVDVSIGLSMTKTLAKLASERAKKEPYIKGKARKAIYVIGKSKIEKELKLTAIEDVWGIGRRYKKLFHSLGIRTAYDFVRQDDRWIKQKLGKRGFELKQELLGIAVSTVDSEIKKPKSIQVTRSFMDWPTVGSDKEYIRTQLKKHVKSACRKLRQEGGKARSVTLMLRRKDFFRCYYKIILDDALDFELDISKLLLKGFEKLYDKNVVYRSCGVTFDMITYESKTQLSLFEDEKNVKSEKLAKSLDKIEGLYGKNIVNIGYKE